MHDVVVIVEQLSNRRCADGTPNIATAIKYFLRQKRLRNAQKNRSDPDALGVDKEHIEREHSFAGQLPHAAGSV